MNKEKNIIELDIRQVGETEPTMVPIKFKQVGETEPTEVTIITKEVKNKSKDCDTMKEFTRKPITYDWTMIKQARRLDLEKLRYNCTIGSDIDEVAITYNIDRKDFRPHRMHEFYRNGLLNDFIKGKNIDVFITGRKYCYRNTTIQSLLALGIYPKYIIFFPVGYKKTNDSLCEYKEEVINLLQLETYYEDDKDIHNYLRHSCPNTNIIKVGGPPIQTLR